MKKFLKSKVGQPIPEREGSVYEPIIDRAYENMRRVYSFDERLYLLSDQRMARVKLQLLRAHSKLSGMSCSDLKSASVPSRLLLNVKFLGLKLIAKTSFHKYIK